MYKAESLPHAQALEVVTEEHFKQGGLQVTVILIDSEREKEMEITEVESTLDLGECWMSRQYQSEGEEDDQVVVLSLQAGQLFTQLSGERVEEVSLKLPCIVTYVDDEGMAPKSLDGPKVWFQYKQFLPLLYYFIPLGLPQADKIREVIGTDSQILLQYASELVVSMPKPRRRIYASMD